MKTEKYNGVTLTVTEEAQKRIERNRSIVLEYIVEILKLIFVPLIFTTLTLSLTFYNHLEQIYTEIISNNLDEMSDVTAAFIVAFVGLWLISFIVFFNRACILSLVCERQSEKRIDYLPLSDEACQKLGIYNVEEYCDFLNHFLFRRPFGKTYKNMSLEEAVKKYTYWEIVKIPSDMLQEINTRYYHTNDNIKNIYFDYDKGIYQIRAEVPPTILKVNNTPIVHNFMGNKGCH